MSSGGAKARIYRQRWSYPELACGDIPRRTTAGAIYKVFSKQCSHDGILEEMAPLTSVHVHQPSNHSNSCGVAMGTKRSISDEVAAEDGDNRGSRRQSLLQRLFTRDSLSLFGEELSRLVHILFTRWRVLVSFYSHLENAIS